MIEYRKGDRVMVLLTGTVDQALEGEITAIHDPPGGTYSQEMYTVRLNQWSTTHVTRERILCRID